MVRWADPWSGRIVNVNEPMAKVKLLRHVFSNCRSAKALGGMVAAGQKCNTTLARQVRLRLGNLARDEGIGPGSDGRLEVALRTARAPRYVFDSLLRSLYKRYRPF